MKSRVAVVWDSIRFLCRDEDVNNDKKISRNQNYYWRSLVPNTIIIYITLLVSKKRVIDTNHNKIRHDHCCTYIRVETSQCEIEKYRSDDTRDSSLMNLSTILIYQTKSAIDYIIILTQVYRAVERLCMSKKRDIQPPCDPSQLITRSKSTLYIGHLIC